jgi:hypothetical protein
MITNQQIEQRLAELRETSRQFAKAKSEMEYLEHFRKSKHALLMREAEKLGFKTAAAQEREAYAHPEYQQLLEGLKIATELSERSRWELEIARMGIDLWRTKESSIRAEAKAYGMAA